MTTNNKFILIIGSSPLHFWWHVQESLIFLYIPRELNCHLGSPLPDTWHMTYFSFPCSVACFSGLPGQKRDTANDSNRGSTKQQKRKGGKDNQLKLWAKDPLGFQTPVESLLLKRLALFCFLIKMKYSLFSIAPQTLPTWDESCIYNSV